MTQFIRQSKLNTLCKVWVQNTQYMKQVNWRLILICRARSERWMWGRLHATIPWTEPFPAVWLEPIAPEVQILPSHWHQRYTRVVSHSVERLWHITQWKQQWTYLLEWSPGRLCGRWWSRVPYARYFHSVLLCLFQEEACQCCQLQTTKDCHCSRR